MDSHEKRTFHTRLGEVVRNLDEFFSVMVTEALVFYPKSSICEDRFLNDIKSSQEENLAILRQGKNMKDPEPSHQSCIRFTPSS